MNDQDGFTLIELLISLSLLSIIVSLMFLLFLTSQQNYIRIGNQVEEMENVRIAMWMVDKEIKGMESLKGKIDFRETTSIGGSRLSILTIDKVKFTLNHTDQVILHTKDGASNQLAHHITGFKAEIQDGLMKLWIKAQSHQQSNGFELTTGYYVE